MEKENTAIRLKKIMADRNLRQIDILELCKPYCKKFGVKLGRNDLSQYVAGKVDPGQKKLTVLGNALNVSEAWLMGFDVPMTRQVLASANVTLYNVHCDTEDEADLVLSYRELSDIGKKKSFNYTTGLLNTEKAELELEVNAAHALPNATEEDKQHDEDIMNNDSIWGK